MAGGGFYAVPVPASPSSYAAPQEDARRERKTVVLLVVGILLAVSVVIAGLVVLSGGSEPATPPAPTAAVAVEDRALVVGPDDARATVVVHEDFGSPESRAFDIASRDFLRIEAARGVVQVRYLPFAADDDGYAVAALEAWSGIATRGTPEQALAFHDVLVDRQPDPGSATPDEFLAWAADAGIEDPDALEAIDSPDGGFVARAGAAAAEAGVRRAPVVLLDGRPVTGPTPVAMAERLQRALLALD